jgi:hypothetical protein
MKTILRKIKIVDRLPEKEGWYAVEGKKGKHGLLFDKQQDWDLKELQDLQIEYWYEEIEINDDLYENLDLNDVFELLPIFRDKDYTLTDKINVIVNKHDKGILEDATNINGIVNDIKLLLEIEVKERYQKALEFLDIPNWVIKHNKVVS